MREECWECDGTGMLKCEYCFDDPDVDEEDKAPCDECLDFGEIDCFHCDGTGEMDDGEED